MLPEFLLEGSPQAPRLVLAHGAGAPADSPLLQALTTRLVHHGLQVVRFEFPFMAARRHGARRPPDPMAVLEASYREVIESLGGGPTLAIGGHSLGGRVASRLADAVGARALVCFAYPYHPPARPDQLRTAHLETLVTPALFIAGTRDPFGSPEEVAGYPLSAAIERAWLDDGDHSLTPRKRSGFTREAHLDQAAAWTAAHLRRVTVG